MTLLEMSATGAVLVGVTVLVRALILHRLPKGTLLLLWWLALARFLLPFSLPSPVSALILSISVDTSRARILAAKRRLPFDPGNTFLS